MAHAEMSSPEYHEDAKALAKLEQAWARAAELQWPSSLSGLSSSLQHTVHLLQLPLRPLIGRTPTAAP